MVVRSPTARLTLRYDDMHAELQGARSLFIAGYYQEAVRKAAERFQNRVREMAGYQGRKTGIAMIRHIFHSQRALLEFALSETSALNDDATDGFVNLAVGMSAGVRNVFTHADEWAVGHDRALELMALISSLHYALDEAEPVTEVDRA